MLEHMSGAPLIEAPPDGRWLAAPGRRNAVGVRGEQGRCTTRRAPPTGGSLPRRDETQSESAGSRG
eukprot:3800993-Alexandrium_andersonii.AAC.1